MLLGMTIAYPYTHLFFKRGRFVTFIVLIFVFSVFHFRKVSLKRMFISVTLEMYALCFPHFVLLAEEYFVNVDLFLEVI